MSDDFFEYEHRTWIDPESHRGFFQDRAKEKLVQIIAAVLAPGFDSDLAASEELLNLFEQASVIAQNSVTRWD